jgi:hypothetical protein
MIPEDSTLSSDRQKQQTVALIARYHRKAVPAADHKIFAG